MCLLSAENCLFLILYESRLFQFQQWNQLFVETKLKKLKRLRRDCLKTQRWDETVSLRFRYYY